MKKVLLSLVTYKNHEVTKSCLRSLESVDTTGVDLRIVVVNNDPDYTFTYAWKKTAGFSIVNREENLGFSGGHNVVLRQAIAENADYVLVLNNDTTQDKHFLHNLIQAAQKEDDQGVFGPKIYFAKGHEFHADRYKTGDTGKVFWYAGGTIDWKNLILSHRGVDEVDAGQYDIEEKTDFVSGCCMLLPVSVLKKSGIFDERYFLYLEDSDLTMRIKRKGFSSFYVPKAVIWHENAGSTGGSGSSLQDYFITRNRLLFGLSYAPFKTKLALLREGISLLGNGRPWQRIGVKDFMLRKFGKGSYHV